MEYAPDTCFELRTKRPHPRGDQAVTWAKLVACIEYNEFATYDALVSAARFHKAGGESFVRYAIKNGWLIRE